MNKTSLFNYPPDKVQRRRSFYRIVLTIFLLSGFSTLFWAQTADSLLLTNQDAPFSRPFILRGASDANTIAVGGYLEGNINYFVTDGIGEGFSMEMRRFNIFLFSTVGKRIKFLSELEFEHGTEEISLETALLDFEIHPGLNFRAGILLPPIGYFNQNHDSPKWEFIDRPLVSTAIIPSTLSEIGFGLHGKMPFNSAVFTYEVYLVNGLQDGIVANEANRTSLQHGKGQELFEEDNNGTPALSGRLAIKNRALGEFGLSAYTGIYNNFKEDGLEKDEKRRLTLLALDYNGSIKKLKIIGEAALALIDIPEGLKPQFGSKQWGAHLDLIYSLATLDILNWEELSLNLNFRFEFVDFNAGNFSETGDKIYDEIIAVVPGISLRFSPDTLLRFNYRYHWERDILGNPPVKTAGFQFGFASYF